MNNNWQRVKLGDICEYSRNRISISEVNLCNYVSTENLLKERAGKTIADSIPEQANLCEYNKGCTLISNIRPYFKKIWFANTRGGCSNDVLVYKPNNGINDKWLYYLLSQDSFFNFVMSGTKGTKMPRGDKSQIMKFPVALPPLDEQKKIAGVLSVLDDKIELNNKINRNLEAQAQAIFKSWFIDFEPFKNSKFIDSELGKIPEGWKVGKLSDIANITMGQSPNGNSYNEKKIGMIFFQGRAEFGWRFPRNRLYTTAPKRIAERDSVLLSIRAPVGDINKALERCCIGRGLASLTSNHKTFLYYKMQSIRHLLDVYNGEGTVFGSINKNTLQEIRTIIPIDSEIIRFELKLKVVDELIRNNYIENLRLIKLRDTLLPELMSGKIDILRFSNR